MWIFVWILLSVFVLGVFAWSQLILLQQKKAWATFAKQSGLTYTKGRITESPVVSGMLQGRRITFYTAPRPTKDARGQRFVTVVEIEFGTGLPATAAIATQEYTDFIAGLKLDAVYKPEGADWKDNYIAKTKDPQALASYLTPERVKTIHSLFSMGGMRALFFFDDIEAVLQIETADPLRDAGRMEKILKKLMKTVDELIPAGAAAASVPAQAPTASTA